MVYRLAVRVSYPLTAIYADHDVFPAVDMWSAGIILLFFLTKKFPLFQSSDDVEALMEIAAIIGKKKMERTATLHSK